MSGSDEAGATDAVAEWNPMVPELLVNDLARSRRFYVDILGFAVRFEREDPSFVYLDLGGAQLMLAQDHEAAWVTGDLDGARGRGLNLQIEVPDLAAIELALDSSGVQLFRAPSTSTYDVGGGAVETQRELLVQDPDGYLLRCVQVLDTPPPVTDHSARAGGGDR